MTERAQERTREDPLRPHPDRLSPSHPHYAEIMAAHDAAVDADQAGYLDPLTGLFVMTAATHIRRGRCCKNGCRHCPFVGGPDHA